MTLIKLCDHEVKRHSLHWTPILDLQDYHGSKLVFMVGRSESIEVPITKYNKKAFGRFLKGNITFGQFVSDLNDESFSQVPEGALRVMENAHFENLVNNKHLTRDTLDLLMSYKKEEVPEPFVADSDNEFLMKALITAKELQDNKFITDFVVIHGLGDYYWFALKTVNSRDELYGNIDLTYTECLYDFLFEHSCKKGYLINHVRKEILPEISSEIEYQNGLGAGCDLLLDYNAREVKAYSVNGIKFIDVEIDLPEEA